MAIKIETLGVSVVGLVAAVVLGLMVLMWQNDALEEESVVLEELQYDVGRYDELKAKTVLSGHEAFFNELINHPNISRHEKRRNSYLLEFNRLGRSDTDYLVNKILNATVTIKKFSLRKDAASYGEIMVEFGG